jgi:hypothetical protein
MDEMAGENKRGRGTYLYDREVTTPPKPPELL